MEILDTIWTVIWELFETVDFKTILVIMGLAQAAKWSGAPERSLPIIVTFCGAAAGYLKTPAGESWRIWLWNAVYYAGAADLFFTVIWQTLLNKVNLLDRIADLIVKVKSKNGSTKEGL